ncbi:MAG: SHOCT domain-containing protein [Anaerolinea sp.]|nr:SHOCT domain-containing protein [Anaerolinea sp.]
MHKEMTAMFMGLGLIFTILLVVGFVYLLNGRGQSRNNLISPPSNNSKSPLDIAQERYARGEIDKEAYEQLRHDLTS